MRIEEGNDHFAIGMAFLMIRGDEIKKNQEEL